MTGRKVQLSLQEQVLIGPMLATFIASLSVRYRLSRVKIQEFLNDWQAVVAFVSPHLPVTNNEAERALRHAVIARHITPGTRSAEGSEAYAALLTVIETCRRRNLSPWPYLSEVIALRRKGLPVHPVPMPLPQAA